MNLLYHNDHNHIKCHTQTPVIISATPLLYRKAEILVISLHGKAKLSSRLTVSMSMNFIRYYKIQASKNVCIERLSKMFYSERQMTVQYS